jgi:hypothetical protein
MIPPLMSSTLNGEDILGKKDQSNTNKAQGNAKKANNTETKASGRPEKPDDQKSDKTIANRESMS